MIVRGYLLVKNSEIGHFKHLLKINKGISLIERKIEEYTKFLVVITYNSNLCKKLSKFDNYPITIFKYMENNEEKLIYVNQ